MPNLSNFSSSLSYQKLFFRNQLTKNQFTQGQFAESLSAKRKKISQTTNSLRTCFLYLQYIAKLLGKFRQFLRLFFWSLAFYFMLGWVEASISLYSFYPVDYAMNLLVLQRSVSVLYLVPFSRVEISHIFETYPKCTWVDKNICVNSERDKRQWTLLCMF